MSKRVALVAVSCGVFAAGFGLGFVVADDSDDVRRLRADVSRVSDERDKETKRASELATQLDGLDSTISDLEDRLDRAESDQDATADRPTQAPGLKTRALGQSARAGKLTITPVAFTRAGASAGAAIYEVSATVKNNASDDISPFCGGTGAELVDSKGRTFDPESDIAESSNTCEDIQPGLTLGDLKFSFQVPAAAKPRVLRLWGELDNEVFAHNWSVRR